MPRVHVKICCMQSAEEALLAVEHGASAIGLVSAMPSGPGPIPEERIPEIARVIPPHVSTFLLTSLTEPADIVAQHRRCGTSAIQFCDMLDHWTYDRLHEELPGIMLVQVIHVRGERSIGEAAAVAPHVDAILLDSGNPSLPTKELGGTGRVHNWNVSRRIRDSVDIPVWLAGGLRPDNVARAVDIVEPYGVDVCSGLRPNGHLDSFRLEQFFAALAD